MVIRQQLINMFTSLYQENNMSILEYHGRFINLGRFSPKPAVLDNPGLAWKFRKGLRPEFRTPMANLVSQKSEEAYKVAIRLEQKFSRAQRHGDYQAKFDRDNHPGKQH